VSTAADTSKSALVVQCQTIITALGNLNVTEYVLGGKTYAKADLVSAFQSYVNAASQTASDKKSYQNDVIAETAMANSTRTLRSLLKTFLQSRFGKTSPELTPFSFSPTKTTKKTVEVKAVAVAKTERTKKALGTMGKDQRKKAIKAIAAQPLTEPAPASSATAPIQVAPSATAMVKAPAPAGVPAQRIENGS
jgi:predicted RNA-binding Zn ribbon-like protein